MTDEGTFVIVGAGLAGAKAAQTLRAEGFAGRIHLVGDEPDAPYERPPLSKGFLVGTSERESVFVHDHAWYPENEVDLLTGTKVIGLDAARHQVILDGGTSLAFDKLLLATGSSPRLLDVPGADLAGVYYLRRLPESEGLHATLSDGGRRVVIIGGGWIGLEVASAARGFDNDVTVVEPQSTVLKGALGQELGDVFAGLHREHGVRLLLDEGVSALEGTDGRVTTVVTTSGGRLPADVVVVGVGVRPNMQLAEAVGLEVDNGVLVNAALRTSHPDIYAAGDIANAFHPLLGRHVRVEHWAHANRSGPAAAKSMLGQDVTYDPIPYFYTDQYDLGMEYSGAIGPEGYDRVVYRGDVAAREFISFWLKDGRVQAGMNVNVWDVTAPVESLIRSGAVIDADRLADPNVPLESLFLPA